MKECPLIGYVLRTFVYRLSLFCRTRTSISVQWWELLDLPYIIYVIDNACPWLVYAIQLYTSLSLTPYPVSYVGISDYHAVSVFLRLCVAATQVLLQSFSHRVYRFDFVACRLLPYLVSREFNVVSLRHGEAFATGTRATFLIVLPAATRSPPPLSVRFVD